MYVLITGSRSWDAYNVMYERLSCLPTDTTLIHGGADGADTMAKEIGLELGLRVLPAVRPNYAYWKAKIGEPWCYKRAPRERNITMIEKLLEYQLQGEEVQVLAFKDKQSPTGGTDHCAKEAEKRGLMVDWTFV